MCVCFFFSSFLVTSTASRFVPVDLQDRTLYFLAAMRSLGVWGREVRYEALLAHYCCCSARHKGAGDVTRALFCDVKLCRNSHHDEPRVLSFTYLAQPQQQWCFGIIVVEGESGHLGSPPPCQQDITRGDQHHDVAERATPTFSSGQLSFHLG